MFMLEKKIYIQGSHIPRFLQFSKKKIFVFFSLDFFSEIFVGTLYILFDIAVDLKLNLDFLHNTL